MTTGLDIPIVEHEVFPNPPLKAMLGQIRFPTVLRIADLASLAPFQEAIRGDFPVFREEQQLSLVVGPQGPQAPQIQRAWRFVTANQGWSFLLTPDAVTLEADVAFGYTSYEEFSRRFRGVWQAIADQFGPAQVSRQGLRYVDHFEGDRAARSGRPSSILICSARSSSSSDPRSPSPRANSALHVRVPACSSSNTACFRSARGERSATCSTSTSSPRNLMTTHHWTP